MGVTKLAVSDRLLTARKRLPLGVLSEGARANPGHLITGPEARRGATVATYVSVASEPGTGPLLDALSHAGKRVILPLVQPDLGLDWAVYDGPAALHTARMGLLEPDGPPLGLDAISLADAVLV